MKISPHWLRDFVDLPVDYLRLADELTLAGVAVEGISGSGDNTVFEMEITTNRPDAMNHYGVARETSALYDLPLKPIEPKLPPSQGKSEVIIDIQEPELCPRFTAREIRGATIEPSPANIASRLQLLDQRPISNAVDATNYVLWETGKPTHVFDLDLLEGRRLVIRKAQPGETLKTLDGVERKLSTDDLVVADAKKPVGLAGVMGGFDTMITERTKNILIESAWWDPVTVRRMSKRHGLHTDASHRFERGADFESTVVSANRVAELIHGSGGGALIGGAIDVVARQMDLAPVELDLREVRRILGQEIGALEISRILTRLRHASRRRRQLSRPHPKLAARCRARDRRHRRNRAPAWLRQVSQHASSLQRRGPRAARCAKRRAPALNAARARLQRNYFAHLYFERRRPALFTRRRARPRQPAQRRGFGDAHFDGPKHVEHAGL
jgi:phenylalanyl-tRNA synthetase beta chain